jgi:hypothetical protein
MPTTTYVESPEGPLVTVVATPSALYCKHALPTGTTPPDVALLLLVDTGASHCLIDEASIQPLRLNPVSASLVSSTTTGAAAIVRPLYDLGLTIQHPDGSTFREHDGVHVSTVQGFAQGRRYQGLIGRDLLDQAVLTFDGPQQVFTLSY